MSQEVVRTEGAPPSPTPAGDKRALQPLPLTIALILSLVIVGIGLWVWQQASYDACARSMARDYTKYCTREVTSQWRTMWGVFAALAAGVVGAVALGWQLRVQRRDDAQRRSEFTELIREVDSASSSLSLQGRWDANGQRLTIYHNLVTEFAQSSRRLAVGTMTTGFIFIFVMGVVAAFASSAVGAAATAAAATAGAALTAFIGQAIIKNVATSSSELISLVAHPIDVERALNAERLIDEMPDDQRAEARMVLIRALMSAPQARAETKLPDSASS